MITTKVELADDEPGDLTDRMIKSLEASLGPDELQGAGLVCSLVIEIFVFVSHASVPSGWSSGQAFMINSRWLRAAGFAPMIRSGGNLDVKNLDKEREISPHWRVRRAPSPVHTPPPYAPTPSYLDDLEYGP